FYAASRWLLRRMRAVRALRASARRHARALGTLSGLSCTALVTTVLVTAALPNLGVLLVAITRDWYGTVLPVGLTLDHFRAALGHALVVPSIGNSLRYVALATTLDLLFGFVIAHASVRGGTLIGKVLDAVAMLPLAVPGLVLAFGYLAVSRDGHALA